MNPWRRNLIRDWLETSVDWFCLSLRSIQLGAWEMAGDETMRAWGAADAGMRCAGLAWGIIDADRPAPLMYRELPMPPLRHSSYPSVVEKANGDLMVSAARAALHHHVIVRLDGQILDPTCPVAELAELDAQSFDETDESIIKRTRTK